MCVCLVDLGSTETTLAPYVPKEQSSSLTYNHCRLPGWKMVFSLIDIFCLY